MPFWLHESRIIHILRELTPRTQAFIALCSVFGVAATTVAYRQAMPIAQLQQIKTLQKILDQPSMQKIKKLAHQAERAPLDLSAMPQTLQFFTNSGFRVKRIERLLRQRSRRVFGYVVCVQGSFETLVIFLTMLKQVPVAQLRLQHIDRISDEKLEIEFFMQGARV